MPRGGRRTGKSITSFQFCERGFSGQGSEREREKCPVFSGSQGWSGPGKHVPSATVTFAVSQATPKPRSVKHGLSYL